MNENIELSIAKEKGDLINSSLNLIEKLSKSSFADEDNFDEEELWGDEISALKNLILSARQLVDNSYWELLRRKGEK